MQILILKKVLSMLHSYFSILVHEHAVSTELHAENCLDPVISCDSNEVTRLLVDYLEPMKPMNSKTFI